jgi:hypothetical protein
MVYLQVYKVVIDRIVNKRHLYFLSRYRLLNPEHLCEIIVYQVLSCRKCSVIIIAVG